MPELWANLGLMQQEAGDIASAVPSFQQANHLNPSLYVPNLFLGNDYVRTGKAPEAIPFLTKAEKTNKTDPQAPLALGRAYYAMGKFSTAAQEFERAVALDPKLGAAWFALGIARLNQVETGRSQNVGGIERLLHLPGRSMPSRWRSRQDSTRPQPSTGACLIPILNPHACIRRWALRSSGIATRRVPPLNLPPSARRIRSAAWRFLVRRASQLTAETMSRQSSCSRSYGGAIMAFSSSTQPS